jgi:hypothetical protein
VVDRDKPSQTHLRFDLVGPAGAPGPARRDRRAEWAKLTTIVTAVIGGA